MGDLDNYSKVICDSLKGSNGLLIDDSQIQRLEIAWIDTCKTPYFEVSISGHPDEYCIKPLRLYEMSNKMFYPISFLKWSPSGLVNVTNDNILRELFLLNFMTSTARQIRHKLRQDGLCRDDAFYQTLGINPVLKGFHKNRVTDSNFELVKFNQWMCDIEDHHV